MTSLSRLRLRSVPAIAAITIALLSASPVHAAGASDETPGGPEFVGTGYTDISTLDVVGWENPEPGQAPPPRHPKALTPRPRTEPIACNGRIDFYRVISTTGHTTCFQKAGLYELPRVISGARFLCPGNNAGQVWYYPGLGLGNWQWSTLRDGHGNFNACYEFQRPSITEVSEV